MAEKIDLFREKKKPKKKVDNKVFDMMTSVSDKTDVNINDYAEIPKNRESIHNALMVAGMTPGIGNVADLADATLYALEGEFGDAAWSAAAAIPVIGQMVTGKKALKAAKEAGEEMVTLYRGVTKWSRKGMVKKGKFVGPENVEHYGKEIGLVKPKGLFATLDPSYASRRTASHFPIHHEKLLKSMKKEKYYYGEHGIPVWPDSKFWNKKDFAKAIKRQERVIENVKNTRKRENRGDYILEFEVPKSYVKKFSITKDLDEGFLFNEGIPVEFLKKIHK